MVSVHTTHSNILNALITQIRGGGRRDGDDSSRGCNYLILHIGVHTRNINQPFMSRQRRCWFWGSLPHQMHQPVNPTNAISQLVHAVTLRGIYYKVFIYFSLFTSWYRANLLLYIRYVGGVSRLSTCIHAPKCTQSNSDQSQGGCSSLCASPLPLYVQFCAVLYNTGNLICLDGLTSHHLAVSLQCDQGRTTPSGHH